MSFFKVITVNNIGFGAKWNILCSTMNPWRERPPEIMLATLVAIASDHQVLWSHAGQLYNPSWTVILTSLEYIYDQLETSLPEARLNTWRLVFYREWGQGKIYSSIKWLFLRQGHVSEITPDALYITQPLWRWANALRQF